jgi:hypothetical protein
VTFLRARIPAQSRHRRLVGAWALCASLSACSVLSSTDDLSENAGGPSGAAGASGVGGVAGAGASGAGAGGGAAGSAGTGAAGGAMAGMGGAGQGGQAAGAAGASGAAAGASGAAAGEAGQGQGQGGQAGVAGVAGSAGVAGATGGLAGQAGTGGAAGAAGFAGTAGMGAAGSAPVLGEGVVVAGALVSDPTAPGNQKEVLTVLDPRTGQQVTSEPLITAAVGYAAGDSEATERWYIFVSDEFVEPTPTSVLSLQIRTLDRTTGAWTTLSTSPVPTLVAGSLVVLNKRLAYLTYGRDGNQLTTKRSLVLLDVASDAPQPLSNNESWDVEDAQGLVGIPSPGEVGGVLDVIGVTASPCGPVGFGMCDVTARAVTTLGSTVNGGGKKNLLSFAYQAGAQATWTTTGTDNRLLVAAPTNTPFPGSGAKPVLRAFSPAGLSALGGTTNFDASGRTLRSLAYDGCNNLAFLTELNQDQAVFAIELGGAKNSTVQSLGKPGQRVLFEPSSHSIVVPFVQGATRSLRAFRVDASKSPPKLVERVADWTPPASLGLGAAAFRTRGLSCQDSP